MADTLDVLTLAEAKTALNIPDATTTYNTELAQVITAASRFVDSVYGPVVRRTVTSERLEPGSIGIVQLRFAPIVSVSSVKEYKGGAESTLTAETETAAGDYRLDLRRGRIYRRESWQAYPFGYQSVVVTYIAGRATDTASADPKFKEAAVVALIHFWQHRGANSGAASFGGDGAPFGGVPFSTEKLREKLASMYPEEVLGTTGSTGGPLVA